MTRLSFSIHGDFLSDHIRDLVAEGSIQKAWNTFTTITDDVNIFRDLIKGRKTFEGVNELTLESCKKEDLISKSLSAIASSLYKEKAYLEKLEEELHTPLSQVKGIYSHTEDDEDGYEMSLGEYLDLKNRDMKNSQEKIRVLEEELEVFQRLFNVSHDDIVLSVLQGYEDKKLSSQYGWITEKGWFLPVPFAGHDQFIYDFNEKMNCAFEIKDLEKRWVRVTMSMDGTRGISAFNFTLKPKQALTLEKWMIKNDVVKDGGSFSIWGYGFAERTGNSIKFKKLSED